MRLSGTVRPVLGLGSARLVLVPLEQGDGEVRWIVIDRERWAMRSTSNPWPRSMARALSGAS